MEYGLNTQALAFRPIAEEFLRSFMTNEENFGFSWSIVEMRNGREQGFAVCIWGSYQTDALRVFFAENRNSDDFFLWTWLGERANFDEPTIQEAGDESFRKRKMYPWLRFDGARRDFAALVEGYVESRRTEARTPPKTTPAITGFTSK